MFHRLLNFAALADLHIPLTLHFSNGDVSTLGFSDATLHHSVNTEVVKIVLPVAMKCN